MFGTRSDPTFWWGLAGFVGGIGASYCSAMPFRPDRPTDCLAPVLLGEVVSDPESIRAMARGNGPYFMPARYLIDGQAADQAGDGVRRERRDVPAHLVGPTWRGDWAVRGRAVVPGAEALLHHEGFRAAAVSMTGGTEIVPEQVFVNLTTPSRSQGFSHTDIPEFVGVDRTNAPGWLLQAMGVSRLFEDVRITIVTAVTWFHRGERGFFRYWPEGRDSESLRHEDVWNTGVVGDNDFMHHQVEGTGPRGAVPPEGLTIDTELRHDGSRWLVVDDDVVLADFDETEVRLSLSWKAKVYRDHVDRQDVEAGVGGIGLDEVLARFAAVEDLDVPGGVPVDVDKALVDDGFRTALTGRWHGYRSG